MRKWWIVEAFNNGNWVEMKDAASAAVRILVGTDMELSSRVHPARIDILAGTWPLERMLDGSSGIMYPSTAGILGLLVLLAFVRGESVRGRTMRGTRSRDQQSARL